MSVILLCADSGNQSLVQALPSVEKLIHQNRIRPGINEFQRARSFMHPQSGNVLSAERTIAVIDESHHGWMCLACPGDNVEKARRLIGLADFRNFRNELLNARLSQWSFFEVNTFTPTQIAV